MLHQIELLVGLLVVAVALSVFAQRVRIPYPIFLVIGGVLLAFVPGLPPVHLQPDLVFLLFLPPILYQAAINISWRDFRMNRRPIALLAIGAVLATSFLVGGAVKFLFPEMPWAVAFVVGAIVSPPDAVAATAIARRLRLPHRVVVILEGESLVNDASGLVAYRIAVAAVVTGAFSWSGAILQFGQVAIGGVLLGFMVAWLIGEFRKGMHQPVLESLISLLTPYLAYLPAERLHVSGVLAVVTAGLYLAWLGPRRSSAQTRLQVYAVWDTVALLINSVIFILIGLQLRGIWQRLIDGNAAELLRIGFLVGVATIVVRLLWVFPATYIPRWFSKRLREGDPAPPVRAVFILGWTGMRGVVSLAAALALPTVIATGEPFPYRDLIIFLTFAVIFVTLVLQGLTLPAVIRTLRLAHDDSLEREERDARLATTKAVLLRLQHLEGTSTDEEEEHEVEIMRRLYEHRMHMLERCHLDEEEVGAAAYGTRWDMLQLERASLIELRDQQQISGDVLLKIQRELDLEQAMLERARQE